MCDCGATNFGALFLESARHEPVCRRRIYSDRCNILLEPLLLYPTVQIVVRTVSGEAKHLVRGEEVVECEQDRSDKKCL